MAPGGALITRCNRNRGQPCLREIIANFCFEVLSLNGLEQMRKTVRGVVEAPKK